MNGPLLRRLTRAREKTPTVRDPSTMTPAEKRAYALSRLDFTTSVVLMNAQRRKEREAQAARHEPAPVSEPEPPPEPVEPKPAPPPPPSRPRHAGEPDPNFVPPQNQFWEERCRFRVRGLDEPYDDEPDEQDELDELIYGSN